MTTGELVDELVCAGETPQTAMVGAVSLTVFDGGCRLVLDGGCRRLCFFDGWYRLDGGCCLLGLPISMLMT